MGQPAGRGETAVGAEMTRPTGRKDTHPKQQQEGQKAGRGKVMFTQNPKGRDEAFKRNILQSGSMGYVRTTKGKPIGNLLARAHTG